MSTDLPADISSRYPPSVRPTLSFCCHYNQAFLTAFFSHVIFITKLFLIRLFLTMLFIIVLLFLVVGTFLFRYLLKIAGRQGARVLPAVRGSLDPGRGRRSIYHGGAAGLGGHSRCRRDRRKLRVHENEVSLECCRRGGGRWGWSQI